MDVAPAIYIVDGNTIIPILEEVLVVEKHLILRDELHIRHVVITDMVEQPVSLRGEHTVVARVGEHGGISEER